MRARVFVTLKPSVFDPQGKTIADALHSLGYGGVDDVRQGKYFELDLRRPSRRRPGAGGRSGRQAAREPGDRELSHRGRTERMKFAIVVFPGSNCDHDAYHAAKHVLGQQAEYIWHKDTDLKGADVVILPGGFAHGDYLRTGAIARFSPIMRAVRPSRRRRPGARHLQRVPGAARSRAAARRDAAQPRRQVPVRARPHPRRADRHAVHARAAAARCCGCRSRTARAITSPSPTSIARSRRTGRSSSATPTRAGRGRPTRPIRTAR